MPPFANIAFPTRYRLGCGRRAELAMEAGIAGIARPLVVTDPGVAALAWMDGVLSGLADAGIEARVFDDVRSNPNRASGRRWGRRVPRARRRRRDRDRRRLSDRYGQDGRAARGTRANDILLRYVLGHDLGHTGDKPDRLARRLAIDGAGDARVKISRWVVDLRAPLGIPHSLTGVGDDALARLPARAMAETLYLATNPAPVAEADVARLYADAVAGHLDL